MGRSGTPQTAELSVRGMADEKNIGEIVALRSETFGKFKPQLDQMDKYYNIFTIIDESPESFINIYTAFEAKAMGREYHLCSPSLLTTCQRGSHHQAPLGPGSFRMKIRYFLRKKPVVLRIDFPIVD